MSSVSFGAGSAPISLPEFEPCLPRPAKQPSAGLGWIHEIKHDGFRSELLPSYSGDAASLVLPRLVSRNIGKLGRDWRASAGRRQPNSS